jgi:hypothetical protein
MRAEELVQEVKEKIEEEKKEFVKGLLKERMSELEKAKNYVMRLESDMAEFLSMTVEDIAHRNDFDRYRNRKNQ